MALPSFDLTDGAFFVLRASFLPAHIRAAKAVSADDRYRDSFLYAQGKLDLRRACGSRTRLPQAGHRVAESCGVPNQRVSECQSVNGLRRRSHRNSRAERDQILGSDVFRSKVQAHDAASS
jgi:hypothetical protein